MRISLLAMMFPILLSACGNDVLYDAFKNASGNTRCMNEENSKKLHEEVIARCNTGGAHGTYGWIEYEFDESLCGEVPTDKRDRAKLFVIHRTKGDRSWTAWRGEDYKSALENTWKESWGCSL